MQGRCSGAHRTFVNERVDRWLWDGTLTLMALVLAAALALITALALGWNNPRPGRPPDWRADDIPRRLEAVSNETRASLLGHPSPAGSDLTFEVIARPLSGPDSGFYGYGLVYRAQDPDHYYSFAVGGDGYYAVLRVAGDEEIPLVEWQQFPHIRRGLQTNRLRVTCAGATCHFTINDEYAATVDDDTWLAGDVGLWVRGLDEGTAVRFLNVRLWREG